MSFSIKSLDRYHGKEWVKIAIQTFNYFSLLSLGSYEEGDKYIVTEQTLNTPYWT
jgi:hypothetical protein